MVLVILQIFTLTDEPDPDFLSLDESSSAALPDFPAPPFLGGMAIFYTRLYSYTLNCDIKDKVVILSFSNINFFLPFN